MEKKIENTKEDHDVSVHGFNKGIVAPPGQRDVSEEYFETLRDKIGEVIVVHSQTGTHVFKKRQ